MTKTEHKHFSIIESAKLDTAEVVTAKNFWKKHGVKKFYLSKEHAFLEYLHDVIQETKPKTVLEFGCMTGRNLSYIKDINSEISCIGIDINKEAILAGKKHFSLDLRHGDETYLSKFNSGSFDLVFTVSVLDHIPNIVPVCKELIRCSKKYIYCLEIRLPEEGKIVNYINENGNKKPALSATYSWRLETVFKNLGVKKITKKYTPLIAGKHSYQSGNYYYSYLIEI